MNCIKGLWRTEILELALSFCALPIQVDPPHVFWCLFKSCGYVIKQGQRQERSLLWHHALYRKKQNQNLEVGLISFRSISSTNQQLDQKLNAARSSGHFKWRYQLNMYKKLWICPASSSMFYSWSPSFGSNKNDLFRPTWTNLCILMMDTWIINKTPKLQTKDSKKSWIGWRRKSIIPGKKKGSLFLSSMRLK